MQNHDLKLFAGVTLFTRNAGKYLVVRVKDTDGNLRTVVIGGSAQRQHYNLLDDFRKNVQPLGFTVTPLGGGRYNVFSDEPKRVYLWHESVEFGPDPDKAVTIRLFAEAFPEFSVGALTIARCIEIGLDPTR